MSPHMICAGWSKRTAASRLQDGGAGVFRAERPPPEPMGPSPPAPGSCNPKGAGVLIAERASAARRARVDPGVPARRQHAPMRLHEIDRHLLSRAWFIFFDLCSTRVANAVTLIGRNLLKEKLCQHNPKRLSSHGAHSPKPPLIRLALCCLAAGADAKFHTSCRRMPSIAPSMLVKVSHARASAPACSRHQITGVKVTSNTCAARRRRRRAPAGCMPRSRRVSCRG